MTEIPQALIPYDPFAGRGAAITFPYVVAPPPSGGDDYARIQSLVNAHNPRSVDVVLRPGTYLSSGGIIPAPGFPLRLFGASTSDYSAAGGTTIRLTQAATALLTVTEKGSIVRGVNFDTNRLASYGILAQGATNLRIIDGSTTGALLDGIHCALGLNQGISTDHWFSYANGKTWATAGILNEYPNNAIRQAVIAGTATTTAGNGVVIFAGAPDLTTLGIRTGFNGDMLRVGSAALTAFYGQILAVTANTITIQANADGWPGVTLAGQDFAIGVGFGWYEELNGGGGYCALKESFFRGNGCGGVFMNGLYGDMVWHSLADGNNLCGIAMGLMNNNVLLFSPSSEGTVYQEANIGPDYFVGNTQDAKIDTPSGGSPLFMVSSPAASNGAIVRGGVPESIQLGKDQSFLIEVNDNVGTLRHKTVADHFSGLASRLADRLIGANAAYANTPSLTSGAGTGFTSGAGIISSGGVLVLVLNAASQNSAPGASVAVEFNSTGTACNATLQTQTLSVNGVSQNRYVVVLTDVNGNVLNWNTTTIPAGTSIGIRVKGPIR